MSAITHGMNVGEVRSLASKLQAKADEIRHLASEVNAAVQHSEGIWKGPDAEQFRSEWHGEGQRALQLASEILHRASQAATKNASEQESTSNRGGGF